MRITVNYDSKNYGNSTNADEYEIAISAEDRQLSLNFAFANEELGQAENSEFTVRGCQLALPLQQARRLATTILWCIEQAKIQQEAATDDVNRKPVEIALSINEAALIREYDVVITVTHSGHVKRTPVASYKEAGDVVSHSFVASTHNDVLIFTSNGQVYKIKVHEIPDVQETDRGKAIVNLINLPITEKVVGVLPVRKFSQGQFVVMVTRKGIIKKTELPDFANIRSNGIIAMGVDEDDELMGVEMTDGHKKIFLATHEGQAIVFDEDEVRDMGRQARGVRGITLREDDYVVSVCSISGNEQMLSISSNGFGKQTEISEYRVLGRGGKGVINMKPTNRTGKVVAVMPVMKDSEVLIITETGKIIRIEAEMIYATDRSAQGVKLIDTSSGVLVAGASLVK